MHTTYQIETAGVKLTVTITTECYSTIEGTFNVLNYTAGMESEELQKAIQTAICRQLNLVNTEIFDDGGWPFDGDHKPTSGQFCGCES